MEESTEESKAEEASLDVSIEEVLSLAKDIGEIFKSSQIDGKKEIINRVFANLSLEQKNLYFSYKKPFNLFVEGLSCTKLYRGRDLPSGHFGDPKCLQAGLAVFAFRRKERISAQTKTSLCLSSP